MIRFITENGRLEFDDPALVERLLRNQQAVEAEAKAKAEALQKAYSVKGLAERLNISQNNAYELIREGKIGYCCCGAKNYRVSERDVQRFEDRLPPLAHAA